MHLEGGTCIKKLGGWGQIIERDTYLSEMLNSQLGMKRGGKKALEDIKGGLTQRRPCHDYDEADDDDDKEEEDYDNDDDEEDDDDGDYDGAVGDDDRSDDDDDGADAWCQCVSGPGESLSIQNWPYPPHYIHQIHRSSKYTNTH